MRALSSAVPRLVACLLEASNFLNPPVLLVAGNLLPAARCPILPALVLRCCRLLYKNDGNAVGRTCWLHIRRLQSDGLHFKGPEKLLIRNDLPWEGTVIEVRHQLRLCCQQL